MSCMFKAVSIYLYPQGKWGLSQQTITFAVFFLLNKDVPSFHLDSFKQKWNHLKVREVVGTIQGVLGLQANHICESRDSRQMG